MRMGPGMKLQRFVVHPNGQKAGDAVLTEDCGEAYWFWCPGCTTHHSYRTKLYKGEQGPIWTFNGDMEKPTFKASLLYFHPEHDETDEKGNKTGRRVPRKSICHLFVTDGQIRYEADCVHNLAGKVIPLGDLP